MSVYEVDYSKTPDKEKEAAKDAETMGFVGDLLGGVPFFSSLFSLGADGAQYEEGNKAVARAAARGEDTTEGQFDRVAGAAGMASDGLGMIDPMLGLLKVVGIDPGDWVGDAAAVAGTVQGLAEMGKGGYQIYKGAETGEGQKVVDGVDTGLVGIKDALSSSAAFPVAMVGKAFAMGLAGGKWLAPELMGELEENVDVRQSDGEYVPSTGWGVSDWVFGAGKYTDSRWAADGKTDKEIMVDQFVADNPGMGTWELMQKYAMEGK